MNDDEFFYYKYIYIQIFHETYLYYILFGNSPYRAFYTVGMLLNW